MRAQRAIRRVAVARLPQLAVLEHVLFELHLIGAPAPTPPALAVAGLIDGDAIDPGAERRLAAERGNRAEDPQEDFLRQVEGLVAVAQQVEGQLENHPFVAGDQFGAGHLLAGGAALNQRGFAGANFSPPECSCVFHQSLGDES